MQKVTFWRRLAREPLIYFGLLAALLLTVDWSKTAAGKQQIIIPESWVSEYKSQFQQQYGRSPGPQEVASYRNSAAAEEVLVRKALALGLDEKDPIIRRRLIDKMQAVMANNSDAVTPTEAQLIAFMQEHLATYDTPTTYSLEVVYMAALQLATPEEEADLLSALQAEPETDLGQFPARRYQNRNLNELSILLGPEFVGQLEQRSVAGLWQRAETKKGALLYRILKINPPQHPVFEQVRRQVIMDWENARRKQQRETRIAQLMDEYHVQWRDL